MYESEPEPFRTVPIYHARGKVSASSSSYQWEISSAATRSDLERWASDDGQESGTARTLAVLQRMEELSRRRRTVSRRERALVLERGPL